MGEMKKVSPIKACQFCGMYFSKSMSVSKKEWQEQTRFCSKKCWYASPREKSYVEKMSRSHYGQKPWNTGKKTGPLSRELKEQRRETQNRRWSNPQERVRQSLIMKKNSPKGKDHWHWKGGITPARKKLYFSEEYKQWRKTVFERDAYTCQICGTKGVIMHADHIKPLAKYLDLALELSNGRTLCVPCHKQTSTYGINGVRKNLLLK